MNNLWEAVNLESRFGSLPILALNLKSTIKEKILTGSLELVYTMQNLENIIEKGYQLIPITFRNATSSSVD